MISFLFAVGLLGTPTYVSCPGNVRCPKQVYSLTYKLCSTDAYTDGKDRTACDWNKVVYGFVYNTNALCDKEGKRELFINYGYWRSLEHKRLWAVEYRCNPLMVLMSKDVPQR